MDFTQDQIEHILSQYKKNIQYNHDRYHNVRKNDEEYQKKNRERAKKHYELNKDKKKEYYKINREELNMKQRYRYYKSKDNVEGYKTKFPDNYKKLVEMGFIK